MNEERKPTKKMGKKALAAVLAVLICGAGVAGAIYLIVNPPSASYGPLCALIGPEGGTIECTQAGHPLHGFKMAVPAGALNETTNITIDVLDTAMATTLLATGNQTKRVLGGFHATPGGLGFNVPVSVVVPVSGLQDIAEVPLHAVLAPEDNRYYYGPTDLLYDGGAGTATMNITGFSWHLVVAMRVWLETGECLLDPCRCQRIHVLSNDLSYENAATDCNVLVSELSVAFLDCGTVEDAGFTEKTAGCSDDTTAPFVTWIHPANGSTVEVDATVQVTFSEAMIWLYTNPAFSITPHVAGTFAWPSNSTLLFTPGTSLADGTEYHVTISTRAMDMGGGNRLAAPFTFNFTAGTRPAVVSASPAGGSIDVDPMTCNITVGFSGPMNETSVESAGGFFLTDGMDDINGTFSWDANGTAMTFVPAGPLEYVETYYWGFGLSAAGANGLPLMPDLVRSFDTLTTPSWCRIWGGTGTDWGLSVWGDGAGAIYTCGWTESFGAGGADMVLVRWNATGDVDWYRTWGGTGHDYGHSVWGDGAGNIYTCGYTYSFGAGNGDMVLVRWNATGDIDWYRTWGGTGGDVGHSVWGDGAGNIYTCGFTSSFGVGGADIVLVRWNATGDVNWYRTWGGAGGDLGYAVWGDGTGAVYTCGWTNSFGAGNEDIVLVRWNATGDIDWYRTWGGTGYDYGYSVGGDGTGTVYTCGFTTSFGAGGAEMVLVRWNATGDVDWYRTWGGAGGDLGYAVWGDGAGNIYTCGLTSSYGAGNEDMVLVRWNATGDVDWYRTWGGMGTEYGQSAWGDGTGTVYTCGWTTSFGAGGNDLVLMKWPLV